MFVVLAIYLSVLAFSTAEKDFPKEFPQCYRNDPKLNNCLLDAAEKLKPLLKTGVPSLNMNPATSYLVPKINIESHTTQINVSAILIQTSVKGIDTYKVTKLEFNPETLVLSGEIAFDYITLDGNYTVDGRILGVPIQGHGGCVINLPKPHGRFTQKSEIITKKGVDYLKLVNMDYKVIFDDLTYTYNGLFEDLPRFAKAADQAIASAKPQLIQILTPVAEETINQIVSAELFKKLYTIPYDKLYPLKK